MTYYSASKERDLAVCENMHTPGRNDEWDKPDTGRQLHMVHKRI